MTYIEIVSLMQDCLLAEKIGEYAKTTIKAGLDFIRESEKEIVKLVSAYTLECALNDAKKDAVEMIKRQAKRDEAEIKKKAINDFVRELKDCARYQHDWRDLRGNLYVTVGEIDFIAEKMIGGVEDGCKEM